MRFAIASLALLAGFAVASPVETVYTTEEVTITSCAASVTNCPGRTHTSTPGGVYTTPSSSVAVPTSVAPVWSSSSTPVAPPPYQTSSAPSISVITVTTCVPSTWLSTITLSPSAPPTGSPTAPAGTGVAPSGTSTPPVFTGAASPLSGSFALAAGAAAAAVLLI